MFDGTEPVTSGAREGMSDKRHGVRQAYSQLQ